MYHKMITEICEKYGKKYTKDLQVKMYGVTDREICLTVVRELKMPISADEFEMQLSDLAKKILPSAPLKKGAERLLTHLHDCKIPMALATNSTEQAVRLHATARPKLFGLFHHKATFPFKPDHSKVRALLLCGRNRGGGSTRPDEAPHEGYTTGKASMNTCNRVENRMPSFIQVSATDPEVDRGKPHPDIYLVAASRFPEKPKPAQCLVFEDSQTGVTAGKEAGMQVVMIPDPRLERDQTRQATIVIRSLLDFKPELFGLPPFDEVPFDPCACVDEED